MRSADVGGVCCPAMARQMNKWFQVFVSAAAVWWSSTSCLIVWVAVPSKKLVVGNQTGDCAHFSQFRGECDHLFARECCLDEHTLLFDLLEVRHFLHVEQTQMEPQKCLLGDWSLHHKLSLPSLIVIVHILSKRWDTYSDKQNLKRTEIRDSVRWCDKVMMTWRLWHLDHVTLITAMITVFEWKDNLLLICDV